MEEIESLPLTFFKIYLPNRNRLASSYDSNIIECLLTNLKLNYYLQYIFEDNEEYLNGRVCTMLLTVYGPDRKTIEVFTKTLSDHGATFEAGPYRFEKPPRSTAYDRELA